MRQIRTSAEHHLNEAIRLCGGREGGATLGGGGQVGTQQLSLRPCLYPHGKGKGRSMTETLLPFQAPEAFACPRRPREPLVGLRLAKITRKERKRSIRYGTRELLES